MNDQLQVPICLNKDELSTVIKALQEYGHNHNVDTYGIVDTLISEHADLQYLDDLDEGAEQ